MQNAPVIPQEALFQPQYLLELAVRSTGLDSFGEDPFVEPLSALLASLESEAQLTPQGVQHEHLRLLKSLTDRLQIQAALAAHPEILTEPIARPLFITGLTRTGTTKLQRVIARDVRWRHLPLWEALHPVPFPDEKAGDPSPRIAAARQMVDTFRMMCPQGHAGHPIFAEEAEEETFSSQMLIQSSAWYGFAHTPSYMVWVLQHSMEPAYRWLRKTLQYLQWRRGGERTRWVLKSPFHLGYCVDLYAVFPDAFVVQSHRSPLIDVVASCCELVHNGRQMSSTLSRPLAEGREVLEILSRSMLAHMSQRRADPADCIIDVDYRDIIFRCDEVIERIYGAIDMQFDSAVRDVVAQWERRNPQHVHGKFVYNAEKFGLTPRQVDAAFGPYAEWLAQFAAA